MQTSTNFTSSVFADHQTLTSPDFWKTEFLRVLTIPLFMIWHQNDFVLIFGCWSMNLDFTAQGHKVQNHRPTHTLSKFQITYQDILSTLPCTHFIGILYTCVPILINSWDFYFSHCVDTCTHQQQTPPVYNRSGFSYTLAGCREGRRIRDYVKKNT